MPFVYEETRSALRLYFEPLLWAVHSANKQQSPLDRTSTSSDSGVVHTRPQASGTHYGISVKDDWRAWLPADKYEIFGNWVQRLESTYNLLSISLDEALSLRQSGHGIEAAKAASIAPELCDLVVESLTKTLRVMEEDAKHYGIVPNAAPLDPENYLGVHSQRLAFLSALSSKLLLSRRVVFLHKVSTLRELTADLGADFRMTADRLSSHLQPSYLLPRTDSDWNDLDAIHYDVNTCFRETVVMMKSFLIALPETEVPAFRESMREVFLRGAPKDRSRQPKPGLVTAEQIAYAKKGS